MDDNGQLIDGADNPIDRVAQKLIALRFLNPPELSPSRRIDPDLEAFFALGRLSRTP